MLNVTGTSYDDQGQFVWEYGGCQKEIWGISLCIKDHLHIPDIIMMFKKNIYAIVQLPFCYIVPHVVGAQLCRLSPVDAHTVALKPLMGK